MGIYVFESVNVAVKDFDIKSYVFPSIQLFTMMFAVLIRSLYSIVYLAYSINNYSVLLSKFFFLALDGVCLQSIEHPGCVWDAKFLRNGDIVTACSDGVVRVWTVHHDRIADPQEAELYASLLSEYKCSR